MAADSRSTRFSQLRTSGLTAFVGDGTLTRLDTVFARDQRSKIYVQDRMREHGRPRSDAATAVAS